MGFIMCAIYACVSNRLRDELGGRIFGRIVFLFFRRSTERSTTTEV